MSVLGRLGDAFRSRRESGFPTSSNRASSLHLRWSVERRDSVAVAVTLEVVEPPTVDRLYFWALQASFVDGMTGFISGGAHLGLQWHPSYPGKTAVNWGGYRSSGDELTGTDSALPSALGNVNTRDYDWRPGTPYRLEIRRGNEFGWWRGSVRDLVTGTETAVRELQGGGDLLDDPVMWSEVFARCDEPSVAVRWSDPLLVSAMGEETSPSSVFVNYQRHADGGCTNTVSYADEIGLIQQTASPRTTPQGGRLEVPRGS